MDELLKYLPLILLITGTAAAITIIKEIRRKKKERFFTQFKYFRNKIKENRKLYQEAALEFYTKNCTNLQVVDNIPLLTKDHWLPEIPINIDEFSTVLIDDIPPRFIIQNKFENFDSFSDAVMQIEQSRIQNNKQYRLLKIMPNELQFSKKSFYYFDKVNSSGLLAFNLAKYVEANDWKNVYYELLQSLNDPSDSIILTGISTLTLIYSEEKLRFIMHKRSKELGTAEGTYHVIPAGEFQPSSQAPSSFISDLDIWKNIMRESAEELLCMPEYDGSSANPFDYTRDPYKKLVEQKKEGNIKVFYLGFGLDPLTLQGEILTCIIYTESAFNEIYGLPQMKNTEGLIITNKSNWGIDFNRNEVEIYYDTNTLAAGESILRIALKNEDFFKTCLFN